MAALAPGDPQYNAPGVIDAAQARQLKRTDSEILTWRLLFRGELASWNS